MPAREDAGLHALVVDDSAVMRRIVGRIVSAAGLDVLEAADGAEALSILGKLRGRHDEVGVALVDWNMEGMDGLTFLKLVKRDPDYKSLPVMMVTAQTSPEAVAEALAGGADEYLMKPFDADGLLAKLELLGVTHS
jgi:two-component system chemotaxis response regulator CheY